MSPQEYFSFVSNLGQGLLVGATVYAAFQLYPLGLKAIDFVIDKIKSK
jgi:hypothetical protein